MINLYAVRDIKAGKYTGVVMFPNDQVALRAFGSSVNSRDGSSLLSTFPEDAQIYKVGSYDDDTAEIISKVEFLVNAIDLKVKKVGENE